MTTVEEMQYEKTLVRAWKDYRYETYLGGAHRPSFVWSQRCLHFTFTHLLLFAILMQDGDGLNLQDTPPFIPY